MLVCVFVCLSVHGWKRHFPMEYGVLDGLEIKFYPLFDLFKFQISLFGYTPSNWPTVWGGEFSCNLVTFDLVEHFFERGTPSANVITLSEVV